MTSHARLAAALAATCVALGAGATVTAAAGAAPDLAAKCRFQGHDISQRDSVPCRGAKSVLSGWLAFGGMDGSVAGPGGMVGTWKCWSPKGAKLGRCRLALRGNVSASFRFD